jgi:subtilase family serine protease
MIRPPGSAAGFRGTCPNGIEIGDAMRRNTKMPLRLLLVVVAAIGTPVVLSATSATASISRLRVQTAAALPRGARALGAMRATAPLKLTIALRPQNASALQSFATAVSTPGSASYRRFVTVDQFAKRFGATSSQISAVQSQLRAQGLTVGAPSANHLTLPVSGSVAQVQSAFSTKLSQVKLKSGQTTYFNSAAVALPATVAGDVQGVVGLDGAAIPQPQYVKPSARHGLRLRAADTAGAQEATGGPQACAAATNEQATVHANTGDAPRTGDNLADAYNFSPYYLAGDFGQGQTVALFEEGAPYPDSDVGEFQGCYGTTAGTVTLVPVDGGPGPYNASDPNDVDGDGEVTLDIDVVNQMAPQAKILVYSAPGTAAAAVDTLTAIVSADQAKVVSISYGACEANTPAATSNAQNTLLQEAAAQGQSVFASSGDAGSEMCTQQSASNTALSVIDPGNQPFITSVGGTELDSYTTGVPNEGVWNSKAGSGSGGGVSKDFTMPAYQSTAATSLGLINPDSGQGGGCGGGNCREVPDVAADAATESGYVVFSNGAWTVTGGTSGSSPFWAGFFALANASSTCRGLSLGFANPALYQIAGSAYLSNFYDVSKAGVISGAANNDTYNANGGLYPVTPEYDMTTGLGSPNAAALGKSLCSVRAPVFTVAVTSPGNQSTSVGAPVSLAVHGADSGGAALNYTASGLPAGLAINAATGVISGRPTTPQTTTVTVAAGDQFTNGGSTAFTWAIAKPVGKPKAKSVKLSGLGKGAPKLALTLAAGINAPALKAVAVTLPKGLSFAGKVKTLDKGITLKSGKKKLKFTAKVKKGVLSLAFKSATRSASLTLAKPAITISKSEAAKIRKHKVKKLVFKFKTTNASKQTVTVSVTLKKLS